MPEINLPFLPPFDTTNIVQHIVRWLPTLVAVGAASFFYFQWQETQQLVGQIQNGQEQVDEIAQAEIDDVVRQLSKIVLVPEGEVPTLSTIKDTSALTENQEFFQNAANGDKIVIYQQARKAYLFRPSTGKLINFAPINVQENSASQPVPQVAGATNPPSPASFAP